MENRNDSHLQRSQIRSTEESGIPELEEGEEDGVAHEHHVTEVTTINVSRCLCNRQANIAVHFWQNTTNPKNY